MVKDNDIESEIPNKRNRRVNFRFDKTTYKWRHRIENLFGKVKENCRLAMRFDKLNTTFFRFIALFLIKTSGLLMVPSIVYTLRSLLFVLFLKNWIKGPHSRKKANKH